MALAADSARSTPASVPLTLDDRYLREEGPVYLSGMQALVRLPIDQSRRDRRAGLRIGTFISGYPGLAARRLRPRAPSGAHRSSTEHDIRHVPGANEELAATALSGTQMLDGYPHSRYDGVVGPLVRQGAGRGPERRRAQARQLRRHQPAWRGGRARPATTTRRRARPCPTRTTTRSWAHGMPVLYPASTGEFLDARAARDRAVALQRLLGGDEARRTARRRRRDGARCHPTSPGSSCRSS